MAADTENIKSKGLNMIERIPDLIHTQTGEWNGTEFDIIPKETFAMACRKINELIDAVNELQKHEEQHLDLLTELNEMRLHQKKEPADPHTFVNWHIVAQQLANDADDAIKTITALEQKDK